MIEDEHRLRHRKKMKAVLFNFRVGLTTCGISPPGPIRVSGGGGRTTKQITIVLAPLLRGGGSGQGIVRSPSPPEETQNLNPSPLDTTHLIIFEL